MGFRVMLREKGAKYSWIQKWWWCMLCCFAISLVYLHAMKGKQAALREISFRYHEMEKQLAAAMEEKEDLELRLASQNDPAWIEMVLMREIGVVPEGWMKVHFQGS